MDATTLQLLEEQLKKYPAMQLQDCIKLLYQHIRGSEHLFAKPDLCYQMLFDEKKSIGTNSFHPAYESIGENSCRFHLLPIEEDEQTLQTLSALFTKSMETLSSDSENRKAKFKQIIEELPTLMQEGRLPFDYESSQHFLELYKTKDYPAIHHSQAYRDAYHPAYRLLRTDFARFFSLFVAIDRLFKKKEHVVIAIDGKCGAGKSTLAELLSEIYTCNIVHMDDFFLPPELRTKERLAEAGGNVHYERFQKQVLPTLKALQSDSVVSLSASYQLFDCHQMDYRRETGTISNKPLTIVEGSYCLRPELREAYDLKIFLDVDSELQKKRLLARNGEEAYQNFITKWIPMELRYFEKLCITDICDFVFQG